MKSRPTNPRQKNEPSPKPVLQRTRVGYQNTRRKKGDKDWDHDGNKERSVRHKSKRRNKAR